MLPSPCPYLADKDWQLEYEVAVDVTPSDLLDRLKQGWRRHNFYLFRPACPSCKACQTMRLPVKEFKPNRSQRRVIKANENTRFQIGRPVFSAKHVDIFMRGQAHHTETRNWPAESLEAGISTVKSFVEDPLPIQEWNFFIDGNLVGVLYVDVLPEGFSAIYSYHDPDYRRYSIGTFMILSLIKYTADLDLPHLYLGYYIDNCLSMQYKARFVPNEALGPDGKWYRFFE